MSKRTEFLFSAAYATGKYGGTGWVSDWLRVWQLVQRLRAAGTLTSSAQRIQQAVEELVPGATVKISDDVCVVWIGACVLYV